MKTNEHDMILVLDFGAQYSQLIARRVRDCGVYSQIVPFTIKADEIRKLNPKGLIFSGGPCSVPAEGSPRPDKDIFSLGLPILGICYGLQVMSQMLGGHVSSSGKKEYGLQNIDIIDSSSELLKAVSDKSRVWMSHGDSVDKIPEGFRVTATTPTCPFTAIEDSKRRFYGVQFHPEVVHSEEGEKMIQSFVLDICKANADWNMGSFVSDAVEAIREKVGNKRVLCGLSGGVDSSVAAVLIHKAIGDQLVCVFVNNGMLRKNEAESVLDLFGKHFNMNLQYADATDDFLSALKGVTEPEMKRKVIGRLFIETFDSYAGKIENARWLAQGTIYPDVIESLSVNGPSQTIKSHHNVGGLPDYMKLQLVEPLRLLFKDEVRRVGKTLGLPDKFLKRHPFPGPGLAIRILGEITAEKVRLLQEADHIFISMLHEAGLYDMVWQAGVILLPVQSVGVMGDERTYENVVALRAVESTDGMTADWCHLPYDFLARVSNRIINQVRGINRVVYDISSKPPATIEWE